MHHTPDTTLLETMLHPLPLATLGVGLLGAALTSERLAGRLLGWSERTRATVLAFFPAAAFGGVIGLPLLANRVAGTDFACELCAAFGVGFSLANLRMRFAASRIVGVIFLLLHGWALFDIVRDSRAF